jgi:serine/threonine-protein kinase
MGDLSLQDTILGSRYRLIHQVGKGGMAYVYKAYDQMLERPVAIKLLKQDFSGDPGFRERFKQEARSAANLSHPNIVTVHDFGIDSAGVYIVMEYIAGTDLKSKIEEVGRFSVEQGINLIVQACAGLGYAHRAGIVHCDVKPQNILITPDQRLKITDFGIARALSTLESESELDVVWGSPQYLAPEQASGGLPTPSSDVYGLGVVMYEIFTGHLPFETKSAEELMKMHREEAPTDPYLYAPDLPEELVAILMKVLSKEPSARYRTADQLGHILANLLKKISSSEVVDTQTQPKPAQAPVIENGYPAPPAITHEDYSPAPRQTVDWKLVWLELLTLLLVGGLIPFWLFIWFKLSLVIQ